MNPYFESLTEELRVLIDVMPDATLVVNERGVIVHANEQVEGLFGYQPDELVGGGVERLIPPRLHKAHEGHRAGFHRDPHKRPMGSGSELLGRRRDGSELPVEISLAPLETVAGRHVISSIRDATERRDTERTLRESQVRLAEAQRIGNFGSWEWLVDENDVRWSGELYRIFGLDPEHHEPSFEGYIAAIDPQDREMVATTIQNAVESAAPYTMDHHVIRPDGRRITLHCRGECVVEDGRVVRVVGTAQDVTEVREAESELARVSHQKAAILEAAGEGVIGLDGEGRVTFANLVAARMLRASASGLMGQDLPGIIFSGSGWTLGGLDETASGEEVFCRLDGTRFPVEFVVSPLRDGDGVSGRVLTFNDITERRRTEAQLQHLADHDALTGLFNRRRFEEELEREIARTERSGGKAAVLMLDLDNFKDVNDSLGHSAGDSLVRAVAAAIRERLRISDIVARIGGDEFAVLLPDTSASEAVTVAESLLETVRGQSVFVRERRARITTSIGVTTIDGIQGVTAGEALVAADVAMYEAKDAGRDRYVVYKPSARHDAINTRLTVLERLRTALDNDGFVLHGQPILDLKTGAVSQFEVLVRLKGEDGDVIPPGAFISTAERFGLVSMIDQWVLRNAIRAFAAADPATRPRRMEVNVSGRSIGDPQLRRVLEQELASSGLPPECLILELTETAAVADLERVGTFAASLRELGCGFALDDFGAGFGSFAYLKRLPFDHLKIDGEFITSLAVNHTDQLLVKAVVDIARGMDKRTVAEFVEDEATLELLREYGVDFAQGFHIGRPVPIEQVLEAPQPEDLVAGRPATARV